MDLVKKNLQEEQEEPSVSSVNPKLIQKSKSKNLLILNLHLNQNKLQTKDLALTLISKDLERKTSTTNPDI